MVDVNTTEIEKSTSSAVDAAAALVISTEYEFVGAGAAREALRGIEDKIRATFDPLVDQAHKHHKSLVAERARHLAPVESARNIIKSKMIDFEARREQERRVAEAALQAEARKQHEIAALAEAAALEAAGNTEDAKAALETPFVAPTVAKTVTKVAGYTKRTVWKYRVVNAAAVPRDYLTLDDTKIGSVVRATKGSIKIPGIEAYSEEV